MAGLHRHSSPHRRTVSALARFLALALLLSIGSLVPTATVNAATQYGYDMSWPQCPNGQPMPPTNTSFVIVGLTNGLAFTENPCLASQVRWARDNGIPAQAYTIATFPTAGQLETYADVGPWPSANRADRLRNVGYAEGRAAAASLTKAGWQPGVVWIDVEPRPAQPWPSATSAQRMENRYILAGLMRALDEAGYGYGLYSYLSGWMEITDSWQLPGVPVWATVGLLDYPAEAEERCVSASFSGGPVYLSQWTDGSYDYNMTCGQASFADFVSTRFIDFPPRMLFLDDVEWLADSGVSTGWVEPEGTLTYRPWQPIARDAMAAFLYRLAGKPAFTAPTTSPFTDVQPTTQFYKEMTWLHSKGIATGYSDGTFRPGNPVNRDAMAAFMYRFKGSPAYTAPTTSPFADVTPSDAFFKEMAWLHSKGVSTGWPDKTYRPTTPVARDAMAAFLHRLTLLP